MGVHPNDNIAPSLPDSYIHRFTMNSRRCIQDFNKWKFCRNILYYFFGSIGTISIYNQNFQFFFRIIIF